MNRLVFLKGSKILFRISFIFLLSMTFSASLTSCRHKDLGLEIDTGHFNVIFDWKNAPDANPSSMALYLYDAESGEPIRFIFQNNWGGTIRVHSAVYNGLCLNADLTDWAVISEGEINEYEISTPDADMLSVSGFSTRAIPRAPSADTERFAETPGMLWGYRTDGIVAPRDDQEKTVYMYPDEKVCHYTVDVYDSGDVTRYSAGGIDATLSGMSEGYLVGKDKSHEATVTHTFVLKPVKNDNSLHSEFLTFGEPPMGSRHHISIYLVRDDGKKWNCNVDVTDQIRNAPDPRHVHIIIRGITLPDPDEGGGMAVTPDVEDWESVNITLKM